MDKVQCQECPISHFCEPYREAKARKEKQVSFAQCPTCCACDPFFVHVPRAKGHQERKGGKSQ